MRRILPFLVALCTCIGLAGAAVRTTNSNARNTETLTTRNTTTNNGATRTNEQSARKITSRTASTTQRANSSRQTNVNNLPRTTIKRIDTVAPRTATIISRSAQPVSRTATTRNTVSMTPSSRISRAATTSQTFGAGYNSCRDAYFTCMDQFCANADDTYRRCMCSSRLTEIKKKQRALGDAADQIQDFKDLNIEIIPKTAAEVNAMLTASAGEYTASIVRDTSDSAQKLAGINAVLSNTKSKSLSTAGTLDIAGDINSIWATTDLASGVNIANLTGENLYNAVHAQCADLVADHCESQSILNMVIAAYGMYIENDCTIMSNALAKKKNTTNSAIRETEREMQTARLDNYNAHNSTSINDCVAKVRTDITSSNACGKDYIHCLDVTGMYLNKNTGEPIYTADFYQLETMVSLSGDILTNQTNRMLVAELNRKRAFAEKSLSTCQDLADDVWDEFMRQAITEIYQGQQSRIRQVKDECLEVVNKCYDTQSKSLRDFSNTKEQLLLGSQLELSEQLCQEKLSACSNLYGGGPSGMQELISTMYNITSQKIATNCLATLKEYAITICTSAASDTLHSYPYACRVYAPGEQKYALKWSCQNQAQNKNALMSSTSASGDDQQQEQQIDPWNYDGINVSTYQCTLKKKYVSCNEGSYLSDCDQNRGRLWLDSTMLTYGNSCITCFNPEDCVGGTFCPTTEQGSTEACSDYVGSLYQKIARYAIQACMRSSETEVVSNDRTPISDSVLEDVNATMDSIRESMSLELQTECERLGGYWVTTQYDDKSKQENTSGNNLTPFKRFYDETGANKKWGYCADPDKAKEYFGLDSN